MRKRILEPSLEEAKQVKKLLGKAKNNTERKRIETVARYLQLGSIETTYKALLYGKGFIEKTVKAYKSDKENFYKTNRKGAPVKEQTLLYEERINKILDEYEKKGSALDIIGIQREYNLLYQDSQIEKYSDIWYLIRRRMKFNYQKPYVKDTRKDKNAGKILKSKVRNGINQLIEKELIKEGFESQDIKNKKI